jgi:hypothetical protein
MIPVTGSRRPIWPTPFREPREPVRSHCHVQRIGVARAGRRRDLGERAGGNIIAVNVVVVEVGARVGRRRGYRQKEAGGVAFGTGDYRDNSMR